MEGNTNLTPGINMIRQSPMTMVLRLLVIELIISIVYLLIRFPKALISNTIPENLFLEFSFLGILIYLFLLIIQFGLIIWVMANWLNEYYEIKPKMIVHHFGVFSRHQESFNVSNVESFSVDQGFWGRVFGYGTIKFFSPVLKQEYYLFNVSQPDLLRQKIEEIIESQHDSQTQDKIIPRK